MHIIYVYIHNMYMYVYVYVYVYVHVQVHVCVYIHIYICVNSSSHHSRSFYQCMCSQGSFRQARKTEPVRCSWGSSCVLIYIYIHMCISRKPAARLGEVLFANKSELRGRAGEM